MTRNDQIEVLNNKYQLRLNQNVRVSLDFVKIFKVCGFALFVMGMLSLLSGFKIILPYLVDGYLTISLYISHLFKHDNPNTIKEMIVSPNLYISLVVSIGFAVLISKIATHILAGLIFLVSYKTWFSDTNPTFKPFLFFKGEELIPENRDLNEYGISPDIINLIDLKMTILENSVNEKSENIYKIRLSQGNNVLKEEELSETDLSMLSRGFRLK